MIIVTVMFTLGVQNPGEDPYFILPLVGFGVAP